ncbi:MAG: chemotaxis-specific protein-glutamate methyltransferase CheB [Bdellovibrionota bacterium]
MNTEKIRVLIIDDSAFARKVIREVLSSDPAIEVIGIARDGLEGLEKISELKPDVVTLDLLMPDLDGLGVLEAMPKDSKSKVIVVSISSADSELGLKALEMGAIDIVGKPTPLPTDRLYDLSYELILKVKAAAIARVRPLDASAPKSVQKPQIKISSPVRLIVIGTSTGGPQALTTLFSSFPEGINVPMAVALHIPQGYTAPMAARISQTSKVKLVEAEEGMEILPGTAVIAPGGQHLIIEEKNNKFYAHLTMEPQDTPHHPSVDVLFQSAGQAAGKGTLGIILTGMGNDGLEGSTFIKTQGGNIISEDASSCVVYGMPRSVFEAGVSTLEVPLSEMANTISSLIS